MSKIINLTPHAINFLNGANNVVLTVSSSGIARAAQTRVHVADVDIGGVSLKPDTWYQLKNGEFVEV